MSTRSRPHTTCVPCRRRIESPLRGAFDYDHRRPTFVFDVVRRRYAGANTPFTLPLADRPARHDGEFDHRVVARSRRRPWTCSLGTWPSAPPLSDRRNGQRQHGHLHAGAAHHRGRRFRRDQQRHHGATSSSEPYLDVALQPLPTVRTCAPAARSTIRSREVGERSRYRQPRRSHSEQWHHRAVGATPSQGSCEPACRRMSGARSATCRPMAVATVMLRVSRRRRRADGLRVDASATGDATAETTRASAHVVDQRGNVAVQSASASVPATVGTAFDYPRITVSAITHDRRRARGTWRFRRRSRSTARLRTTRLARSNAGTISCSFGTLECRREPRHLDPACGRSSRVRFRRAPRRRRPMIPTRATTRQA